MAVIGILPLARPTFDVALAEEKLAEMLRRLVDAGHRLIGPRTLLFDGPSTEAALDALARARPDQLLILQVTFTDALAVVAAANRFEGPLSIWAVPEPRLGGRLRLNAFCGLNLASHALARRQRRFSWLYAAPEDADVAGLLAGNRVARALPASPTAPEAPAAAVPKAVAALRGRRIGRVGAHPDGFDTCAYDAEALERLTGIAVEEIALDTLFETARAASPSAAAALHATAAETLDDLDTVDAGELDQSLRLKLALDTLRQARSLDAFAIRCWPETFTEYGGAVCGPVSLLGEARVPCACEADVYGAVTQLLLQALADAPVFLVDLVDMDVDDDTGVVWHCGQAPLSMAAERPTATVHTNRRMPLLYQFRLKPGPVTLARISQAGPEPMLVLAEAEMLDRPMAFTGTSGVLRFPKPVKSVLDRVIASGLEHHMGLVYGAHRAGLIGAARALNLSILELTA
ncbi:MAG: hypothetical protein AAF281_01240 [Pseudomonadota bacterium]